MFGKLHGMITVSGLLLASLAVPAALAETRTVVEVVTPDGAGVGSVPVRLTSLRGDGSMLGRTNSAGRMTARGVPSGNYCLSIGFPGGALPEPECCAYRKLGHQDTTVRLQDDWLCDNHDEMAYLLDEAREAVKRDDMPALRAITAHYGEVMAQHERALIELSPLFDETWAELYAQIPPETQQEMTARLKAAPPREALNIMREMAMDRAGQRSDAGGALPVADTRNNGWLEGSGGTTSNHGEGPIFQITTPEGHTLTVNKDAEGGITSKIKISQNDTPSHDRRGAAIPQAAPDVNFGDAAIRPGHFYTIIGYEVVTAPDNFFYSHAFTMFNSEPFTHTGALMNLREFNRDALGHANMYRGWTSGWDRGVPNPFGGPGYDLTPGGDGGAGDGGNGGNQ